MNRKRLASLLRHRVARDALLRCARDSSRLVGAEAWLIGGYVRDAALGHRATDIDLIAGRGALRWIGELARRWSTRGFRFRKRGVTTWRFAVGGRQIDVVDASRRGLSRDLRRRDFTCNAVAFDLAQGLVVDPLAGLADLRRGRLRLPRAGVIREDPVRALRAARFLAQFPQFTLHADARREVASAASGLRRVARERVRVELDKLLLAEAPQRGLQLLASLDLLPSVLPELVPLGTCQAGSERPDVWRHTLDALARSGRPGRLPAGAATRDAEPRRMLRWALLLHDISKPETLEVRDDGRPTFHGHEVLGARRADALLERLCLPRRERRRICRLILNHLRPGHLADAGPTARGLRRLVREAGDDLPLLVLHSACDALASGSPDAETRWRRLRGVLRQLLELWNARVSAGTAPALLDGRLLMQTLGLEPGPLVGRLLRLVRERQEEGKLVTREQALAWLRRRSG